MILIILDPAMWDETYVLSLEHFLRTKKYETRRAYAPAIRQFFTTFGWISPDKITIIHARQFKETLLARGKKETTTLWRIAAMSSFMRYLKNQGHVKQNPFRTIDRNDINPEAYKVICKYTVKDVLKIIENTPRDVKGLRDRAIRIFVLLTKCSREELANLRIKDLRNETVILRRKETYRTIELPKPAKEAIDEYWKASGRTTSPEHGVFTITTPRRGLQLKHGKKLYDPLGHEALRRILKRTSVRSMKKLHIPKIDSPYKNLPVTPTEYSSIPISLPDETAVQAYVRLEEINEDL